MTDDDDSSVLARLAQMALQQPEPQRLLFVFAGAELPAEATPEQRERFARGAGGALVPWMTVDKDPAQIDGFAALADEASAMRAGWAAVFVAALAGRGGEAPAPAEVERALQAMEEAIRQGRIEGFLVLDRDGDPLRLSAR